MSYSGVKLYHDLRAAHLSNRTLNALAKSALTTWDSLVAEACRTPNVIRGIPNLGPKGVKEIIIALETQRVPHTIRTKGPRNGANPRR